MGWTNLREVAQKLFNRREAYRALFVGPDGALSPYGRKVLEDLAKFCRADRSTATISPVNRTIDPYAMAIAEGRREVYLRILASINMDVTQLMNMSTQNEIHDGGEL